MLVTGLLGLPQELLQHIAGNMSSREWASAAVSCRTLYGVPLRTLEVDHWAKFPPPRSVPLNTNIVESALRWLAHHSCSAKLLRFFVQDWMLDHTACQAAVGGLHWPDLRAASIELDLASKQDEKLARDWLHACSALRRSYRPCPFGNCFHRVPPFMGLKHVCITVPSRDVTRHDRELRSLAAGVAAYPHLETLDIGSNDMLFIEDNDAHNGLDLKLCPNSHRQRLNSVWPTSMMLPKGCSLLLALPTGWWQGSMVRGFKLSTANAWEAWADCIPCLRCKKFYHLEYLFMDKLRLFTRLEHLEVEDPWNPYHYNQPIPLLDFSGGRSLSNLTVLKVVFSRLEDCENTEGRGVSLILPAVWCLKVLVVVGKDEEASC